MAILSDKDIVESMMTGYLGISDYSERSLTPNGYDLRIAEISIRGDEKKYTEGTVSIPPRTMFYVSTIERVRMADDICAQLWLRTSWIRKGVMASFGKIDAGFEGTLTLGAYNATDEMNSKGLKCRLSDKRELKTYSPSASVYVLDIIRE